MVGTTANTEAAALSDAVIAMYGAAATRAERTDVAPAWQTALARDIAQRIVVRERTNRMLLDCIAVSIALRSGGAS